MDGNRSFDEYRMPDEMWDRMKPLLPEYDETCKRGRGSFLRVMLEKGDGGNSVRHEICAVDFHAKWHGFCAGSAAF